MTLCTGFTALWWPSWNSQSVYLWSCILISEVWWDKWSMHSTAHEAYFCLGHQPPQTGYWPAASLLPLSYCCCFLPRMGPGCGKGQVCHSTLSTLLWKVLGHLRGSALSTGVFPCQQEHDFIDNRKHDTSKKRLPMKGNDFSPCSVNEGTHVFIVHLTGLHYAGIWEC